MNLGVEDSLAQIEATMQKIVGRREKLLKESRDGIASCSKAIVDIHNGKMKDARSEIVKAEEVIRRLRKEAGGSLARYLIPPESELVEAVAVEALVLDKPIPSADELGVSPESYLLGLLDGIGELKRLLLDSIMQGEISNAKHYFTLMEMLYSLISPFAIYDNVVTGLRRKIDVARMLTEDVRGIMAEEARRAKLVSSMTKLAASLEKRKEA